MSRKRVVIALGSGSWEELDSGTELVVCSPEDILEAQRTGKPPEGQKINVAKMLRLVLELIE